MRNLILLAAIALAVAGCDSEAFTLVGADGEMAVIRLSPAAHESSKLAAQELAEYVFRICQAPGLGCHFVGGVRSGRMKGL